jgi:arginyl-tRNA synthetase
MERFENRVAKVMSRALSELYGIDASPDSIQVQATRKDQKGDFTIVVFPYTRFSGKKPEETAMETGRFLANHLPEIELFEVVKGFVNLVLSDTWWLEYFKSVSHETAFGHVAPQPDSHIVVVEYSSPNTNKPLHLGHIRNNLLGYAVSKIIEASGHSVAMVNLVNDRGIHICKSMLAWQKWGNGITPEKAGVKGDKLVGDFYVRFDREYKLQVQKLVDEGLPEESARASAALILEAQEMLRKWE